MASSSSLWTNFRPATTSISQQLASTSSSRSVLSRPRAVAAAAAAFSTSPAVRAPPPTRERPTAHSPFPRMAPPRRASAMERMSPVDQAELGRSAAPPAMRPFNKGDILAPSDLKLRALAPTIRSKTVRKALVAPPPAELRPIDPFVQLSIDPSFEYLNGRLLSSFVTSVGRIKTRAENGLLQRSQRRVRKGIRRAQAMGLMPRWNNGDALGEKRPVSREGHSTSRDWSVVEGEREQKIDQRQ